MTGSAIWLTVAFVAFLPIEAARAGVTDLGTEAQRADGKTLYTKLCSQCHGEDGDGQGQAKDVFRPAPRDFTQGAFKIRTTESGEIPTTDDLMRVIQLGMPYTGMPPWQDLSDEQLRDLAYHVKTFSDDFALEEANTPPVAIAEPPPFSQASADLGRAVYEKNKCISCHGNTGKMDGESAPQLKDDWGTSIRPADLTKKWTFRGGATRKDIYRTFTTGLNGTPMPSYADSIPEDERWQLVDYVFGLSPEKGPGYGTVVVAKRVLGAVDLDEGGELFDGAPTTVLPIVGQVMEQGRCFFPAANSVDLRAVFDQDELAIEIRWHDMTADKTGSNSPTAPVTDVAPASPYSDAVALQFPGAEIQEPKKPYFLFGDRDHPVLLWYADLAGSTQIKVFEGRGGGRLNERSAQRVTMRATFEEGEWVVAFKRALRSVEGPTFEEGRFVPLAISIWDGFSGERGAKRGLSSWYHVFLEPTKTSSAAMPVAISVAFTVLLELTLVFLVRRRVAAGGPQQGSDT